MPRRYFQFGGDFNPITQEEVDYDPESMFRFAVGENYYVMTTEDIRNLIHSGRTIKNPVTNLPFTRQDKSDLLDFSRRHLPNEVTNLNRLMVRHPQQAHDQYQNDEYLNDDQSDEYQYDDDYHLNPLPLQEVDYDPESMFRFAVGDNYYVMTIEDIRHLMRTGRSIKNPVTNLPFTRQERIHLRDFSRRHLPGEVLNLGLHMDRLPQQSYEQYQADNFLSYNELVRLNEEVMRRRAGQRRADDRQIEDPVESIQNQSEREVARRIEGYNLAERDWLERKRRLYEGNADFRELTTRLEECKAAIETYNAILSREIGEFYANYLVPNQNPRRQIGGCRGRGDKASIKRRNESGRGRYY